MRTWGETIVALPVPPPSAAAAPDAPPLILGLCPHHGHPAWQPGAVHLPSLGLKSTPKPLQSLMWWVLPLYPIGVPPGVGCGGGPSAFPALGHVSVSPSWGSHPKLILGQPLQPLAAPLSP